MFALSTIGVFLWLGIARDFSGQANAAPYDTPIIFTPTTKKDAPILINPPKAANNFIFYASHQTLYFNSTNAAPIPEIKDNVTDEIGTYDVNLIKLTWNKARQSCAKLGGELLIIRSDAEQKHVEKLMHQHGVSETWLGLHDLYEEGDWVSIRGEEIAQVGWAKWTPLLKPNPDNYQGKQHCAILKRDANGMDDIQCTHQYPYVCKMPGS